MTDTPATTEAGEAFLRLGRFVTDCLADRGLLTDPKIEVALPAALDRVATNREPVAGALTAWGAAIRNDWGVIDGRQCRSELAALAAALAHDAEPVTYERLCVIAGVCPEHKVWLGDCPDGLKCEAVTNARL